MKKRFLYGILVAVLGANLFVGAQIYFSSAQAAQKNNLYSQMELFVRVLEKVRQEYVDPEKVSYEKLIQGALRGMFETLDPHSEFMEPAKYDDLRDDTEGAFGGVGIVVGLRGDTLTVVSPMEDTPAFRAGILAGDKIVGIDGKSTDKISLSDAVKKLRGQPGSEVSITISRENAPEPREIPLVRAVIKVDTVKDLEGRRSFSVSGDKIGYVRLTQFGEQTAPDLKSALNKMKSQGMESLVLDLRNNPGGLLDQAVNVCQLFVPRGQLIVSTEGRGTQPPYQYKSKESPSFPSMKMVILVNGGSASASEIVAGCLQDLGMAYVMGEQTFGKGSVQSIVPFPDGYAMRLTTAKYYTPSHKVIHEVGIMPDSIVPMTLEEEESLYYQRAPGGLEALDGERRERVEAVRDVQLERAMDFLKGMSTLKDRPGGGQKVATKK